MNANVKINILPVIFKFIYKDSKSQHVVAVKMSASAFPPNLQVLTISALQIRNMTLITGTCFQV